jgi:hypothetical protein
MRRGSALAPPRSIARMREQRLPFTSPVGFNKYVEVFSGP